MSENPNSDNDNALPISAEERDELFAPLVGKALALCVSGGADSMALMHLVAEWAAEPKSKFIWKLHWKGLLVQYSHIGPARFDVMGLSPANWLEGVQTLEGLSQLGGPPHIVVLTVDHGLRRNSAEEAAFVASEAAKLGLPHQTLTWLGEKPETGIQEGARKARYRLLLDLVQSEAAQVGGLEAGRNLCDFRRCLLMAHHQEDQAETVLMRLARGSGLEGLAGMRKIDLVRRGAQYEGTHGFATYLYRPVLETPKARLVATLRERRAGWIEDPSNADTRFERVRVRNVMEQLKPLGFSVEKIALSARRLGNVEDDLFDQFALDWVYPPPPVAWNCGLYGEVRFERRFFENQYLLVRILRRLISAFGGGARAAELAQVEAVAQLMRKVSARSSSGGLTLGGCKIEFVGTDRQVLRIYREGKGEGLPELELNPSFDLDWDGGRFKISTQSAQTGAYVRPLRMKGWAKLKKDVPELATLGWSAAAMATMPVIAENGEIVAYPVIDRVIGLESKDISREARDGWSVWSERLEKHYSCSFCQPWRDVVRAYGPSITPD